MSRGTRRRCEKRGGLVSQEPVVMSVNLGSVHRFLKQYHMETLLISFHLNGHTLGVHLLSVVFIISFHMNGDRLGFYPLTSTQQLNNQY